MLFYLKFSRKCTIHRLVLRFASSYQSNMAKEVLDTIMSIQPKDSGGGSGETRESVVYRLAGDMLGKLPADYLPHEVYSLGWFSIGFISPYSVSSHLHASMGIWRVSEDPAHRILSCQDPRDWTMPRGRPQALWLRQVESYLKDTGMAGLASAWAMVRRRPI